MNWPLVLQQVAFLLLVVAGTLLFYRNIRRVRRNILLGKNFDSKSDRNIRMQRLVLNAVGQKKMFKKPMVAFLHFFLYAGFIIINLEILEITIDGLFGTHRIFYPFLGNFYPTFITFFEFLAVMVIVSCVIFLVRRNIIKVRRFESRDMTRWPRLDANIILFTEIGLMTAFLTLNTADQVLQSRAYDHYTVTGGYFFSGLFTPIFENFSNIQLVVAERTGWWLHIIGIFLFLNYIPFSKHLHIFLAFPNSWYSRTRSKAQMRNMPEIQREVALMMDPSSVPAEEMPAEAPTHFGARDVTDLEWRDLLAAYSCTECGRCTQQCPANQTGKLLSPRKIMMDTRDRCEDLGLLANQGKDTNDGKSLLGDYILHEEVMACTTCQACVEACPVNINPLAIINELRRYIIMDEAKSPSNWNVMFGNIENNQAPWQFSPADRARWAEELNQQG